MNEVLKNERNVEDNEEFETTDWDVEILTECCLLNKTNNNDISNQVEESHEMENSALGSAADGFASFLVSESATLKSYAKAAESSLNEHDFIGLSSSFGSFCTSEVTMVAYYPKGNPYGHSYVQSHGLATTTEYLHALFSCAPDSLFLVHDTQLVVSDEDGSKTVKSKFTCNGTILYSLGIERCGVKLPDAPSVAHLMKSMKGVSARTANTFNVSRTSSVQLRRSVSTSKFDRYKPQKGATIGAHIEYSSFSESSMQNKKKKLNYRPENASSQPNSLGLWRSDSASSGDSNGLAGLFDPLSHIVSSSSSGSFNTQSDSGIAFENANRTNAHIAQIRSKFDAEDTLIADGHNRFSYSDSLPAPTAMDVFGVMKLHLDKHNKAYLLEFILAAKDL